MCYVCHNSHASPNPKLLVKTGRDLCLGCHEQFGAAGGDKKATWHKPAQDACLSCHSAHATDHEFVLKKPGAELCASCHKKVLDEVAAAPVKHGALDGKRGCMGCHDAHTSPYGRMLRDEPGKLCLACHNKDYPREDERPLADLAKLIKENPNHHGPIREQNCAGCHTAHGGRFRLLTQAYPATFYDAWKPENYALCFNCHRKEVFTDESSKLTRFRDGDRNLHFLHVNRERKGRTCRACHETHASRNAHHIRDKTPFGSWDMPIGYKKTPTGGTCAPGCHTEQSYVVK
jgi:predicted CXXCH cytochrome family protein